MLFKTFEQCQCYKMFFKDIKAKKLNHGVNENQNSVFTDQIFGVQNDTIAKLKS